MQFRFGWRGAGNTLPGHSAFLTNAETEVNPRFSLPCEEALAYAIGLHRVVYRCWDVTGGTVVCPDDEHGGGGS